MPEPSNSPINSDEERYGNGVNAKSVDRATDAYYGALDQMEIRARRGKRRAGFRAGDTLPIATEEEKDRGW